MDHQEPRHDLLHYIEYNVAQCMIYDRERHLHSLPNDLNGIQIRENSSDVATNREVALISHIMEMLHEKDHFSEHKVRGIQL